MSDYTYEVGDEDPSIALTWKDRDGAVIDLSAATFSVKLVDTRSVAIVTKTTGITGAATAPNIVISWAAGELNITPATYKLWVQATVSSRQRTFRRANPPTVLILDAPT